MSNPFVIVNNVPPEYTALTDAISEFLYACGSKTMCGACFGGRFSAAGYNPAYTKEENGKLVSAGCCASNCPLLGSTGCVQKPYGCAHYVCSRLEHVVPAQLLRRFRHYLARSYFPGKSAWIEGLREAAVQPWRPDWIRSAVLATQRIKRLTKWLKLTGWHPNWPLVEKLSGAEPGTLTGAQGSNVEGKEEHITMAKKTLKSKSTKKTNKNTK